MCVTGFYEFLLTGSDAPPGVAEGISTSLSQSASADSIEFIFTDGLNPGTAGNLAATAIRRALICRLGLCSVISIPIRAIRIANDIARNAKVMAYQGVIP